MPFDAKAFQNAKLEDRTEAVPVSELSAWFSGEENPVWTVRGLTGKELGRVNEAAAKNRNVQAIVEKILANSPKKIAAGVQDLITGPDTPDDVARRIDMMIAGSVDPACDLQTALKLCEAFPVVFYRLTNKILELTGAGRVAGGPKPSGSKPA